MLFINRLDHKATNALYKLQAKYLFIGNYIKKKTLDSEKIDSKIMLSLATQLSELNILTQELFMSNNLKGADSAVVEEAKRELADITGEEIQE